MSLDDSAKESNLRDSIKRFFIENLYKTDGVHLTFDKYLSTPNVQGHTVDRWASINFGSLFLSEMSTHILEIYCCTRKDSEGFKLAQLRDKVYAHMTDNTMTDGMAAIPFYRSRATGAWTLIGSMLVQDVMESQQFEAEDGTKFKILTVKLRFSSKV
jgi:hypothetical protein